MEEYYLNALVFLGFLIILVLPYYLGFKLINYIIFKILRKREEWRNFQDWVVKEVAIGFYTWPYWLFGSVFLVFITFPTILLFKQYFCD